MRFTTSSMEATAIAGLEWACIHDWKAKPDLKLDWVSWMYKRVGELEVLVKQQRTEWMEKGSLHPSVIQLNEDRKSYFLATLLTRPEEQYSDDEGL